MIKSEFRREAWSSHPLLSGLLVRSDFDGDSALTIDEQKFGGEIPDLETLSNLDIEQSLDVGKTWKRLSFDPKIAFIDQVLPGWYLLFRPLDDSLDQPLLRAWI